MTMRQDEALKTKEKLIASARKIINKNGLKNTSILDITNDANVAKGTFYTYFKTKEDIIKELIFKDETGYDKEFLNQNLKEKIRFFNENLQTRIASSGIEVCRSWISNNLRKNELDKIGHDKKSIEIILNSSIENGELDNNFPLEEYSNFIVSLNYGEMLNWCMTDGKFNPQEKTSEMTEIILNSLKIYLKENSYGND